ncbi:hypothetical protein BDY17DRAFT_146414 [Neohortaea acidophila]|uniref:Uncharacterized protein n=1 Tax=Neohortaea acidophila TaxID=245834 RepID=A0A6A6PUL0_9PEZI|nr:uncharacterized protein BDY17DRAFT_146414 [Neohortaea acidophila]KAF2483384.1 hypothetical protein BDY17DRAFT_146414 [Neohortaea acidophila]
MTIPPMPPSLQARLTRAKAVARRGAFPTPTKAEWNLYLTGIKLRTSGHFEENQPRNIECVLDCGEGPCPYRPLEDKDVIEADERRLAAERWAADVRAGRVRVESSDGGAGGVERGAGENEEEESSSAPPSQNLDLERLDAKLRRIDSNLAEHSRDHPISPSAAERNKHPKRRSPWRRRTSTDDGLEMSTKPKASTNNKRIPVLHAPQPRPQPQAKSRTSSSSLSSPSSSSHSSSATTPAMMRTAQGWKRCKCLTRRAKSTASQRGEAA